jgi:cell division septal protein FtsQ
MSQKSEELQARNVQKLEGRPQQLKPDQASVFRKAFVATLGALAAIAVVQIVILILFALAVGIFGASL